MVLLCLVYYVLFYHKKQTVAEVATSLLNNGYLPNNLTLYKSKEDGKFMNIKYDSEKDQYYLKEETDAYLPNNEVYTETQHGSLTEISEGFRISGINKTFTCPEPFYWNGSYCKLPELCGTDYEYKGIPYAYKISQFSRGLNGFHDKLYIECPFNVLRECPDGTRFKGVDTISLLESPCVPYDICADNVDGYRHTNKIDDYDLQNNQYYICEGGKSTLITCDDDLNYDEENNTCISEQCENDVKKPLDENNYYICRNGVYRIVRCENGVDETGVNCNSSGNICGDYFPLFIPYRDGFSGYQGYQDCNNGEITTVTIPDDKMVLIEYIRRYADVDESIELKYNKYAFDENKQVYERNFKYNYIAIKSTNHTYAIMNSNNKPYYGYYYNYFYIDGVIKTNIAANYYFNHYYTDGITNSYLTYNDFFYYYYSVEDKQFPNDFQVTDPITQDVLKWDVAMSEFDEDTYLRNLPDGFGKGTYGIIYINEYMLLIEYYFRQNYFNTETQIVYVNNVIVDMEVFKEKLLEYVFHLYEKELTPSYMISLNRYFKLTDYTEEEVIYINDEPQLETSLPFSGYIIKSELLTSLKPFFHAEFLLSFSPIRLTMPSDYDYRYYTFAPNVTLYWNRDLLILSGIDTFYYKSPDGYYYKELLETMRFVYGLEASKANDEEFQNDLVVGIYNENYNYDMIVEMEVEIENYISIDEDPEEEDPPPEEDPPEEEPQEELPQTQTVRYYVKFPSNLDYFKFGENLIKFDFKLDFADEIETTKTKQQTQNVYKVSEGKKF